MNKHIKLLAILFIVSIVAVFGVSFFVADTVTQAPVITSLSQSSGKVGTVVTMYGSNFTSTSNSVKFGGGYINNLTSNGTVISFTVPDGLTPCVPGAAVCPQSYMQVTPGQYQVSVTNDNGTSGSVTFTVTSNTVAISPDEFAYGLDYARFKGAGGIEDPGQLYSQTGATWIKFPFVSWNIVQPKEDGPYDWRYVDSVVKNYQEYDFEIFMQTICNAEWAVEPKESPGTGLFVARPPREGTLNDPNKYRRAYADFIYAVVERYDGDGIDDMPGLQKPITHLEIESEAQHEGYWQVPSEKDPIEEYIKLLEIAYKAAHNANPDVVVILNGINFGDIFDDGTMYTYDELLQKVNDTFPHYPVVKDFYNSGYTFIYETLKMNDYYDAVEFHYNQNYKAAYGVTKFIRNVMLENGSVKPIWAGDALIANSFVTKVPIAFNHPYPRMENKIFFALDDPKNPYHNKAWEWHLREQSANLVKKIMVSFEVGLSGIMAANEFDWKDHDVNTGNWRFGGFYGILDKNLDGIPLGKRPVFYQYKYIIDTLGLSPESVERIDMNDDNTYVYRVVLEDGLRVFVAWYEDPVAEKQILEADTMEDFISIQNSKRTITIDFSPYISSENVEVIHTITEHGQSSPYKEIVRKDKIVFGSVPVFIKSAH